MEIALSSRENGPLIIAQRRNYLISNMREDLGKLTDFSVVQMIMDIL